VSHVPLDLSEVRHRRLQAASAAHDLAPAPVAFFLKQITQRRFGRLLIVRRLPPSASGCVRVVVRCDCGISKTVALGKLCSGNTRSCGCLRRELQTIHGHGRSGAQSPEYLAWANMLKRCLRPNYAIFASYGGRGISVTKRWLSFPNFLADMGLRPSPKHSLDRRNNDKGYSKRNCRWATRTQQMRNTRSSVCVRYRGQVRSLPECAELSGIRVSTLRTRLRRGWELHRLFTRETR